MRQIQIPIQSLRARIPFLNSESVSALRKSVGREFQSLAPE